MRRRERDQRPERVYCNFHAFKLDADLEIIPPGACTARVGGIISLIYKGNWAVILLT